LGARELREAVQRDFSNSGGVPNGIRTRVSALKGPRPGPLDDGDDERTDATDDVNTRLELKVSSAVTRSPSRPGAEDQVLRTGTVLLKHPSKCAPARRLADCRNVPTAKSGGKASRSLVWTTSDKSCGSDCRWVVRADGPAAACLR